MKRIPIPCVCGYNTPAALARHKKTCKVIAWHEKCDELQRQNAELATEKASLVGELLLLREQKERADQEIVSMEACVRELRTRLDESRKTTRTQNNNVTINITPYGQEAQLTHADVCKILSSIPSESVPKYIEMKHFRQPETANIRIPNKRGRTLQVLEEDTNKRRRWVDKDRNEMLSAITDASLDELIDKFDAEKYISWNEWFETSGLKEEGYDKTDAFRKIMKKVENVITSQNPSNVVE